ncbi:MAG: PTS sugar transporter subunit IIA [Deltaproteobacteria bacterium]|nr:PTS sugar transporter subunit IIA [Deltaproteobacteria bacterium]
MNIAEITGKDYIISDLKAKTKKAVLTELSGVFSNSDVMVKSEAMVEVLLEREKLGSTGIGEGIAIPHGKLQGLNNLIASIGRSKGGIDFESLDGKPVHIFFLLMAPENSAGQHLKALAKISRMLKDDNFKRDLLEADSKEDIYNIVKEKDGTLV